MKKTMIAFAALATILGTESAWSQTAGNDYDNQQVLLAQIQSDKRAVMMKALELTDVETAKFSPIYDEYQKERKELAQRKIDVLNKYVANYESMTDDAAKSIMKDWFKITEDESSLMKKYAKRVGGVLPAAKTLRFVQVENKLNTLLSLEAVRSVPLAK